MQDLVVELPRESMSDMDDAWVSELEVGDESVAILVRSIALECHDLALSRGIPSESVELQLPLVLGVFGDYSRDLILACPVATSGAAEISAIKFSFIPLGYRAFANAAKDRVLRAVDADFGGIV